MPGEYGLKKDRDRKFFAGEFLWSGIDYLGEPTPYDVFPVKASFFGAVDTAGFPKDLYYLFKSQWTSEPMVHLRADELDRPRAGRRRSRSGRTPTSTPSSCSSTASRSASRQFDHKTTTSGTEYLETTEATGDDKTVTGPVRAATPAPTAAPASCT